MKKKSIIHFLTFYFLIGISMNSHADSKIQCVLDMGSNTFKFAVFKKENNKFKIISSRRDPMGVGDDISQNKKLSNKLEISDSKLSEIDKIFLTYQTNCKNDFKTNTIKALATAAFRDAKNSDKVIQIGKKHSINIKIVSIQEEAELAFRTANHTGTQTDLVLDFGSRTTEIANKIQNNKLETKGFEFGYRTLFKDFFENKTSIIDVENALYSYLDKTLPIIKPKNQLKIVEFGEAAAYLLKTDQEQTDEKSIEFSLLEKTITELKAHKNFSEHLKEKNIDRALPRILTAYWFLKKTGVKEFVSVDRELYYGLLE